MNQYHTKKKTAENEVIFQNYIVIGKGIGIFIRIFFLETLSRNPRSEQIESGRGYLRVRNEF